MSNANRTHAPSPDPEARAAAAMALCGWPGSKLSDDPSAVTCKVCLQRLALQRASARAVDVIDESGLPVITPSTWAARGCVCGDCAVCRHLRDARQQAMFPPRHIRDQYLRQFRWASVSEAIESYAILRIDGFDAGKSIQDAIAELARLGAFVDQSSRDPIRKAHLQAVEVELFERTIRETFEDHEGGWRRALAILLVRSYGSPRVIVEKTKRRTVVDKPDEDEVADSAGLSVAELRSLVRRARQALTVELAVRDLLPPPSPKHRAWGAYEARMRALVDQGAA